MYSLAKHTEVGSDVGGGNFAYDEVVFQIDMLRLRVDLDLDQLSRRL